METLSGPPGAHRGFSAATSERVFRDACRQLGAATSTGVLLRLGENALWSVQGAPIVVRIARSLDHWGDAELEVQVARWLAAEGFPAASLWPVRQPIKVDGHPVTFWRFIDGRAGDRRDIETLAVLVKQFHDLSTPADFVLPPKNVLDRVEARVAGSPISPADRELLLGTCEELREAIERLDFPLPAGPTHGDAHVKNLMIGPDGPVLIDYERCSWGHPEWDLSMTATEYLSAGWWTAEEYARFVTGYGWDVTSWDGFDVLRRTHEIKMTTWVMQNAGESPELAAEYETRMHTIRTGEPGPWRPY